MRRRSARSLAIWSPPRLPEYAPATLEAAMAEAEGNWAWQAAVFDLDAAREAVAVSLAAMKPRLTLGGEVGYALDGGQQYGSGPGAAIGATLTMPLYQGGGEHARVRQSKEFLSQRRYGRDDALRAAETAIVDAWESGRTAEAAIRSIRRQVTAARFAAEGVRQEARVGARSVVDVLDAERELFEAEVDLARAERERTLAAYRLLAAVGRLTGQDLALPVAYHDPEAHYEDTSGRWFGLGPSRAGETRRQTQGTSRWQTTRPRRSRRWRRSSPPSGGSSPRTSPVGRPPGAGRRTSRSATRTSTTRTTTSSS